LAIIHFHVEAFNGLEAIIVSFLESFDLQEEIVDLESRHLWCNVFVVLRFEMLYFEIVEEHVIVVLVSRLRSSLQLRPALVLLIIDLPLGALLAAKAVPELARAQEPGRLTRAVVPGQDLVQVETKNPEYDET